MSKRDARALGNALGFMVCGVIAFFLGAPIGIAIVMFLGGLIPFIAGFFHK